MKIFNLSISLKLWRKYWILNYIRRGERVVQGLRIVLHWNYLNFATITSANLRWENKTEKQLRNIENNSQDSHHAELSTSIHTSNQFYIKYFTPFVSSHIHIQNSTPWDWHQRFSVTRILTSLIFEMFPSTFKLVIFLATYSKS